MAFINWRPVNVWATASGNNAAVNAQIDRVADNFKAIGPKKVFMTLHHEPENDVSAGNCNANAAGAISGSPAEYRTMWRTVRNRFTAKGVTNVVWVMNYMNFPPWDCLVNQLYPGDDLVDWIVFNAYGGPNLPNYNINLGHFYDYLTNQSNATHDYLSKPWGIVEWASRNSSIAIGGSYYDQAKAALDTNRYPKLKLQMSFDNIGPEGNDNRVAYDHTGKFQQAKQDRYNAWANHPGLKGTGAPIDARPTVALTQPAANSTLSAPTVLHAEATDDDAIAKVEFLRDGTVVGQKTAAPYEITWDPSGTPAGSHSLQARATDSANQTTLSRAVPINVVAAPDETPPSMPTGLAAVLNGPTLVDLDWNAATDNVGVAGYNVYRDGAKIATVTAPTSAYQDTAATDGQGHAYRVEAFDAADNVGPRSATVSPTLPDETPPEVVSGLNGVVSGPSQVTLTWQASTDNVAVTGYRITRSGSTIATTSGLTWTDTVPLQGQTYLYNVQALDAAGNVGPMSPLESVTVPDTTAPTAPGKPTTILQAGSVKLTWTAATDNVGVTGYTIKRNGTVVGTTTNLTYTDPAVPQGTLSYTVTAKDAAGNSGPPSAATSVGVGDSVAPTMPANFGVTAGTRSAILSWTASTDNVGVVGYQIFRNNIKITTVTTTTHTNGGLVSGATYSFKIRAIDAAGNLSPFTVAANVVPR